MVAVCGFLWWWLAQACLSGCSSLGGIQPEHRVRQARAINRSPCCRWVNQSGDPAQEYFSDGLTEELINGLGQIPELRVIGRTSSFPFKGKDVDLRAIGQALGAARCWKAACARWSTAFGSARNWLMPSMAASAGPRITTARSPKSSPCRTRSRGRSPISCESGCSATLRPLLRSRAIRTWRPTTPFFRRRVTLKRRTLPPPEEAIASIDEAIRLDPNYAEAYALKARALNFLAIGEGARGRPKFEEARTAARTALTLKPDLASAHAAMAYIYMFCDWNFPAAEAELAAVRQKDASALNNLASLRALQGGSDEVIALRQAAVRLETIYADYRRILAIALMRVGRLDEAEESLRKAVELHPEARFVHYALSLLAVLRGDFDNALREAELEQRERAPGRLPLRDMHGANEQKPTRRSTH